MSILLINKQVPHLRFLVKRMLAFLGLHARAPSACFPSPNDTIPHLAPLGVMKTTTNRNLIADVAHRATPHR